MFDFCLPYLTDQRDQHRASTERRRTFNRYFKIERREGNENMPALKVNLRSFSLYSDYSYPLTLSNADELSWR